VKIGFDWLCFSTQPPLLAQKRVKLGLFGTNGLKTSSKPECRNPKQARISQTPRSQTALFSSGRLSVIRVVRILNLFRVSRFPRLRRDKLGPAQAGLLRISRSRMAPGVRRWPNWVCFAAESPFSGQNSRKLALFGAIDAPASGRTAAERAEVPAHRVQGRTVPQNLPGPLSIAYLILGVWLSCFSLGAMVIYITNISARRQAKSPRNPRVGQASRLPIWSCEDTCLRRWSLPPQRRGHNLRNAMHQNGARVPMRQETSPQWSR